MTTGRAVVFRCDGSARLGLGHLVRCLALADIFREEHGIRSTYAMREDSLGFQMVRDRGYPVATAESHTERFDYCGWLLDVLADVRASALVLDVRDDLSVGVVERVRAAGILVAALDDCSDRRLASDLVFCPPVPQVRRLDWRGFHGRLFAGWEWVVLRTDLRQPRQSAVSARPTVLVTMGGSDPASLTLKVLQALDTLTIDFDSIVVLGPGFADTAALRDFLTDASRRFDVRERVESLPALMSSATISVVSFGVSAYELAALGIPAIHVCLTEDHAESASAFVDAGIAWSLGVYVTLSEKTLANAVERLLLDKTTQNRMTERGRSLLDGAGAARVSGAIAAALH